MDKRISQQITQGVIWKQLLSYFFPILLGTFFQQMYNTVDTVIVGRYVGTQALAAVGATTPLINLVTGFFVGLSSGATVLVSQFYGAEDRKGVHKALHSGIALALVMGAVVLTLGITMGGTILQWMKTPESCMDNALRYARLYFAGAISSMVYNMGAGILRAMGDSKRPTIFLIITCLLNIAGDLLFVLVFRMGVAGVALATALAQTISACLVLLSLARLPEEMAFRPRDLRLEGKLLRRILLVGVPAGLQMTTFDLAGTLIQSGVNSFGELTVAAWTAYYKSDFLTWMISGAFGVSITTFVGQNFGAQKYSRIRQSVWVCMGMSVFLVGLLSAVVLIFRHFILGIYTEDAAVIATGAYIMLWIVPFNAVFMPVEVFAGAMRGTGYSVMPTVITCICVCLFRVLWVVLVVNRWHRIELLAVAYPISWILAAVVFYIGYLRGTWLHKQIALSGMEPEKR
jgi:putative MATE family efflux protein